MTQEALTSDYILLVWKIANRLNPRDPDSAFSAGLIGLANAVRLYEPDKGFKFTTYAGAAIQYEIQRAAHTPRELKAVDIIITQDLFYQRTGRKLSAEQLATLLDEKAVTIHDLLNNNRSAFLSLEELLQAGGIDNKESTFVDNNIPLPEEEAFAETDKNIVAEVVQNFLQELPDDERSLLTLYFGIGLPRRLTQEEIALLFGVTQQAIKWRLDKVLAKLSSSHKLEELYAEV